ncbi:MAG: putative membrane-anchored protein [Pseudohongiellaceae bacterium]|jgi:uncharacterized membrane-anchored protein
MKESNPKMSHAWLLEQKIHPQREVLTQELHARPFEVIGSPSEVFLFAKLTSEKVTQQEFDHLVTFCQRHQLPIPANNTRHYTATNNHYRFRWERHTEFTTCTLFISSQSEVPFKTPPALEVLDWFSATEGELLVATQISIQTSSFECSEETLSNLFETESIVSAELSQRQAQVWTDLRIHLSGFNRILLVNYKMSATKLGRIVQYLLDIATYRNMALLALPIAQATGHKIAELDERLSALLAQMSGIDKNNLTISQAIKVDSALHDQLGELSLSIQLLVTHSGFRLSGSKAYYAILKNRIEELEEVKVVGCQTIGEFIRRRLDPAMLTCHSIDKRLDDIAKRTSRAVDLLRTRLDLTIEKQNHQLLESMNQRAHLQMNLQETIEGVSIAAVTYYIVGLVGYLTKSVAKFGVNVQPELITGAAVIPVALIVWYGIKQIKKRIRRQAKVSKD